MACGLITLLVGSGIFFTWWIARAWFAVGLYQLEGYGFLWMLISIPIGLVGLGTSLIAFGANLPKIWKKTGVGVLVVLINIPVLFWIVDKQSEIDERVYFKIKNISSYNLTDLQIHSKKFSFSLGNLVSSESTIDYYLPTYPDGFHTSFPEIDSVFLNLKQGDNTVKLNLPTSYKGSCVRLIITDSLTLESRRMDFW